MGDQALLSRAVTVFRTASVPPQSRASTWSEIYERCVSPTAFHPVDQDQFEAELRLGAIGPVKLASVRLGQTSAVERTRRHVESVAERILTFLVFVRGEGVITHHGHESTFAEGDTVLIDNTSPSLSRYDTPAEVVVVRTSDNMLRRRLPHIDDLCGRRLPRGSGLADTAFAMAKSLSESCFGRGLPTRYGPEISGELLDVFATACAIAIGEDVVESPQRSARATAARELVEARLDDPLLNPARIADMLGVSQRYLRAVMADGGECLSAYILRRRLEECAKGLASPAWRGKSITDVAFAWGFNSSAHFSRVFKDKYGVTPREYRRRATGDC